MSYFDNLKALLNLVVVGHVLDFGLVTDNHYAQVAFSFIYAFHMPLFVFVSGLFVNRSKLTAEKALRRVQNEGPARRQVARVRADCAEGCACVATRLGGSGILQ